MNSYLLDVMKGRRRGPVAGALRAGLTELAMVYSAGLDAYLVPYQTGIRKQYRLPCPVVSIGNMTTGGTGKTPMTRRLCELLQASGVTVCVLNRGYRGGSEYGAAVVSTRERVERGSEEAGDEAYLLARSLPGVPVIAGKDRRRTGMLAWEQFRPDAILLDDGMQFYQLYRDLDIVLLDAARPFDNGWTLPRGLLREPPAHLRRAGAVVLTNSQRVDAHELEALRRKVQRFAPRASVYTAAYQPVRLRALCGDGQRGVEWLRGRRVASLCALANPAGFEDTLIRAGAELVHTARFPDHHRPSGDEVVLASERALALSAEAVIVTDKDAVKIQLTGLRSPFYALEAVLAIENEIGLVEQVLRAIGR